MKYHSHRAELIQNYIAYKRSMGYAYKDESPYVVMDRFFSTHHQII